jgi:twitching motility protein PilT
MPQLDKIIKVMLDQAGSELALAANTEPTLRVEGAAPHVLINRKLPAPQLRQLLGELVGEDGVAKLEAADGGELPYTFNGVPVIVQVRSWKTSVETRIRSVAGKRGAAGAAGAAIGRIELKSRPRGPDDPPPSSSNPLELDMAEPSSRPAPFGGEGDELDLGGLRANDPPTSKSMSRMPNAPAAVEARSEAKIAVAAGEPPINALFKAMLKKDGSDLHLSTGERPMIRRDGDMARLDDALPRFKDGQVMDLIRPILPARNLKEFEAEHDTDFAYEIAGVARFRGNVFIDRRGVGAVFRTIPVEVATVEKLGLSPAVQNLCYLSKGLVLVTGPTGSGKSTTLSALVDLINRTRHDHIVTIEDPIEFVHQNKSCLINQREVGPHTESFARALRAALREDPDVVMVGEMRDLETMAIAMETAETGHLVFGTLHTSTSYSTIDRVIDSFPADRQAQIRVMLSESLKGVLSQTLCRKIGGGRVAAVEVMLVNSAISNVIREGKTFQIPTLMQTSRKQGMILLNDALFDLVERKKVDPKEAYIRSVDKAAFVAQLRTAGHKLDFLGG